MNFRSGWNGAENGNQIKSERWFKISTYYAIMSLVDVEFDFLCHYRISAHTAMPLLVSI